MSTPAFTLPTMAEIARVRGTSGLKVASTFAGCGGSCLGYEEAGFEVAWANEFFPAAQDAYEANHGHTLLDRRDVRLVQPGEILDALGLDVGELDVFNGSPPCQAFSTVGDREKGWGKEKEYAHGVSQQNETMFDEYIRLLRGLQPKVFVAENVSGLVKGTAVGMFKQIGKQLEACGYKVEAALLDARWLGVPQTRLRLFFVGVRNDLVERGARFAFPTPLLDQVSIREALPWVVKYDGENPDAFGNRTHKLERRADEPLTQIGFTGGRSSVEQGSHPVTKPSQCIVAIGMGQCWISRLAFRGTEAIRVGPEENLAWLLDRPDGRRFSIHEIKRLASFPDDFILKGSYPDQWARVGNSVPPRMMNALATSIRETVFAPLGLVREGAASVW